jgi:hypothetical protein
MSGGFRVSDSTIETAAAALFERLHNVAPEFVTWAETEVSEEERDAYRSEARAALSAALPSLVVEIREQIAGEIEAVPLQRRPRTPGSMLTSTDLTARQMRDAAARVARGDAG